MTKTSEKETAIDRFLRASVHFGQVDLDPDTRDRTRELLRKALGLIPQEAREQILGPAAGLSIVIERDTMVPLGMKTRARGSKQKRSYTVTMFEEHTRQSEDLFLGSILRQLAHVALELPPEEEWPPGRAERARYIQASECRADAAVWKWGLRHYSMRHLDATYPRHWVDSIVKEIEEFLSGE